MEYMAEFESAYNNGYKKGLKDGVKHGEWIDDYPSDPKGIEQGYRCSNCNTFFFMNKMFVKRAKYCPNCGARMDGES